VASPLDRVAWPVRTQRLVLRPALESDVEAIWRYRRIETVSRWLTSFPASREEHVAQFAEPERLGRTLVVELDAEVIGDLMLLVEDAWSQSEVAGRARGVQAELGWCLAPDAVGRGYASEAVDRLIDICFENLGLRRVTASCFADNEDSWRLMERLGMRRESYGLRESLHRSGRWLDSIGYALLADERQAGKPQAPRAEEPEAGVR
jgi:RimJ/RimL family protein N-acetyltransferase